MIQEYFTVVADGIELNKNEDTISIPNGYDFDGFHGTAYGNVERSGNSNMKYIWKFKVISKGIDSSNKMHTDRYYYDSSLGQKFYVYRMGDTGYKYENDME